MAPAPQPNGLISLAILASLGWLLFWLWPPAGWIYVGIVIASVARVIEDRRKPQRPVIVPIDARPVSGWSARKDTATFPRGGAA